MKKINLLYMLFGLLLFPACSPAPQAQPIQETPAPTQAAKETETPVSGGGYPAAVFAAQADLAASLGLAPEEVQVIEIEPREWTDSCLGLGSPAEICMTVITPGYLVRLNAGGQEYVYHTDADGKSLRRAGRPGPAGEARQPDKPVIFWQREGGFAGFCDTLEISAKGSYSLESCKGATLTGQLTESQLELLQVFKSGLIPFSHETRDKAVADSLSVRLVFNGSGSNVASPDDQQAIGAFAAEIALIARASASPDAERDAAQAALDEYLTALNSGDFILGAKLYGGETETLQGWNPDIENDLPKWLERGCTQNGLQCLPVRTILYRGPDERGGYQFLVEFSASDGSLFHQGPCCGDESPGPFPASFRFSVLKSGENWLVMDLPPYMP
jgi:hypothetical protein